MFLRVAIFLCVVLAAGLLAIDAAFRNPFEVYENYIEAKSTGDLTQAQFLADRLTQQNVHSSAITQSDRLRLKAELADTFAASGDFKKAEKLYTEILRTTAAEGNPGAGSTAPAGYDITDRAALRLKLAHIYIAQKQANNAAVMLHKLGDDVTGAAPAAFSRKIIFTQMMPVAADFTKLLEDADLSDGELVSDILSVQDFLDRNHQVNTSTALKAHLLDYLKSDATRMMDYVRALQDLAKYNLQLGNLDQAQTYIEEAIAQLTATFDRQSVMLLPALAIQGQINNARGEPRKTTDRLEEALELVELYGDPDMPGAVEVVQTLKAAYELRGKSRKSEKLDREYVWMIDMGPIGHAEQAQSVEVDEPGGPWHTAGTSRVYYWSRRAKADDTEAHTLFVGGQDGAVDLWAGRADVFVYEQNIPPSLDESAQEDGGDSETLDLTTPFVDARYSLEIRGVAVEPENFILQRIKAQAGDASDVLLIVHDAANSFKDAVRMAAYVRHRVGFAGPVVLLDWRARDHRFGYRLDRAAAEDAAPDLARLYDMLKAELPKNEIFTLTVGAGAKTILSNAAAYSRDNGRAAADHLILWGPDTSHRTLKRATAEISAFKEDLTLYQLNQSASLLLSRRINVEFAAGDAASGVPKSTGIDVVRGYAPGLIDVVARNSVRDDLLVYDLKRLLTETADIRARCGLRPVYGARVDYWIVRHKDCARITIEERQPGEQQPATSDRDMDDDSAAPDAAPAGGQPAF